MLLTGVRADNLANPLVEGLVHLLYQLALEHLSVDLGGDGHRVGAVGPENVCARRAVAELLVVADAADVIHEVLLDGDVGAARSHAMHLAGHRVELHLDVVVSDVQRVTARSLCGVLQFVLQLVARAARHVEGTEAEGWQVVGLEDELEACGAHDSARQLQHRLGHGNHLRLLLVAHGAAHAVAARLGHGHPHNLRRLLAQRVVDGHHEVLVLLRHVALALVQLHARLEGHQVVVSAGHHLAGRLAHQHGLGAAAALGARRLGHVVGGYGVLPDQLAAGTKSQNIMSHSIGMGNGVIRIMHALT